MPAFSDLVQFFRGQVLETPTLPSTSLSGKTIVITGANTGLGFECAKQCVQLGASTVVLGCRNLEKGEKARQALHGKTEILLWHIDMLSFDSVRAFSKQISTLPRIDALVCNAGIDVLQFKLAEGFESTLTVNVLSTFLLAKLVLPQLRASATGSPTHLSIVGSNVHCFADESQLKVPILSTLSDPKQAQMASRYFLSKLMVMQCTRELAKEVDSQVIINCPSPGWCKTDLFRVDDGGFWGRNMLKLIGRTAEVGARNITSAIVADLRSHGQYMSECRVKPASVFVRSRQGQELQRKVWQEVNAVIEKQSI